MEVYDRGIDFVDIVGNPDHVQDSVGIEFNTSYFCKEERTPEEMFIEYEEGYDEVPVNVPHKLSDDELDQLQNI